MTHQLSWELQNRIIRWAFDTQLNMVALNDATTRINQMLQDSSTNQTHILLDMSQTQNDPNLAMMLSSAMIPLFFEDNMGWMVIYGAEDTIKQNLRGSVTRMMRMRYRVVDTYEEAMATLVKKDSSIPFTL
jgi:hypothetical protein